MDQRQVKKKGTGASLVINLGYWYGICEAYSNIEIKMNAVDFLKSSRYSQLSLLSPLLYPLCVNKKSHIICRKCLKIKKICQ